MFRKIAEGDEHAFAIIFDHYFQHLYLLMLKYTRRHADAEDIVQHIFVKLWENRDMLANIDHPAGWLFATARNEFRDRFRKLRISAQYRQYLLEIFEEEYGSPEETLIIRQQQILLKKALASLPPRQQQAYLLSREQGLTYEEIAQEMGLERTTVKEHIARAVKAIRAFIMSHIDAFLWAGMIAAQVFFNFF